ncbi:uncharacterized protein CEXT_518241 [Caerostris extrusa]|uniref:Uncharacterized protein n=1 Tax=Caerostris extrusa TaxID=172846 RepID=A0AAV4T934_CAEEX|nr:uncharacterized protein CEXT_518241 [Caerostris extrusa]
MDIKPHTPFIPTFRPNYTIITEDIRKIALCKAFLQTLSIEQERSLYSFQRRIKEGSRTIELMTRESNDIELKLNTVEMKIAEAVMVTEEAESEALQTVKENGTIKRKIIALKNDLAEQDKVIKRANETINAITRNAIRRRNRRKAMPKKCRGRVA